MGIVAIVLAIALILKDVTVVGDRYVMRALAQGLCLLMALWVPMNLKLSMIGRYSVIFAYLLFLFLTNLSDLMILVQLISFSGVILFFIGYVETQPPSVHDRFLGTVVWSWFTVCSLSLVSIFVLPDMVYDVEMDLSSDAARFRGLFSKPGMMGSAAGLMVGIAILRNRGILATSAPVAVGVLCLVKTGSRTFWVALLAAMSLTFWFYRPKYRVPLLIGVGVAAAGVFLLMSGTIPTGGLLNKVLRAESLSHMSGRTSLWDAALAAVENSPYIGFGYTKGAQGLLSLGPKLWDYLPNIRGFSNEVIGGSSLHNGFVQALMDSGYIGLALYVVTSMVALVKVAVLDSERAYPVVFYGLVFSIITNLAEVTIYAAAVFHSVLFWYCCVRAYKLRRESVTKEKQLNASFS
jgi:hypothetical protein